jgi:hypothetical protein
MKKVILALALVTFAVTNSFAAAKPAKTMEFGVDAGVAVPLSPSGFTDDNGIGFGGGAFGRYIINKTTSVGLAVAYNTFSGKSVTMYGAAVDAPSFGNFDILAQGKIKLGTGSATPYVLGGVGLAFSSFGDTTVTIPGYDYGYGISSPAITETVSGGSTTNLELQPGFGVEFGTKTKFFAEAKLSIILSSGDTTMLLPINVGVQF